ncbi:MAG: prefoldin subunit alpha [Candidatus Woesearchaeota archaeon]
MTKKESGKESEGAREIQQKYLELQLYDQQMRQAQQQMQAVEQQVSEIEYVVQCINDVAKVDVGTEIFIPISAGVFLKAKLLDNKDALINVGAGTAVKKTLPEVMEMMKTQSRELRKVQEDIAAKMEEIARRAALVESEVRKLTGV